MNRPILVVIGGGTASGKISIWEYLLKAKTDSFYFLTLQHYYIKKI
jgi:uridine kinase